MRICFFHKSDVWVDQVLPYRNLLNQLTGKFAGWGGQSAAVEGSSHQDNAHLLCGALEHLHITVFHRLFMALLGHHKGLVRRLHLDEGITRWSTLEKLTGEAEHEITLRSLVLD